MIRMKENLLIELIPNLTGVIAFGDTIKNHRGVHYDQLFKQPFQLESGTAYGVISEYEQGCELFCYLLGGVLTEKSYAEMTVRLNGKETTAEELRQLSWVIEPYKTKYEKWKVKKSIETALKNDFVSDCFEEITEAFGLTEPKYHRQLRHLSGERWFASMAIGYALGKRIFFAPYQTSLFYKHQSTRFQSAIDKLKSEDCIVLLPCGTSRVLSNLVDECLAVDLKAYDL